MTALRSDEGTAEAGDPPRKQNETIPVCDGHQKLSTFLVLNPELGGCGGEVVCSGVGHTGHGMVTEGKSQLKSRTVKSRKDTVGAMLTR